MSVAVAAGGVICDIAFEPRIAEATIPRLTEAVLRAYSGATTASAKANSSALPPRLAALVDAAIPEDTSSNTGLVVEGEDAPGGLPELSGGDRAVKAWARVNEIGVDAAMDETPVPRLPVTSPGFNEAMRSRMEAIVARTRDLEPELAGIQGRAASGCVTLAVGSSGTLTELSFRPAALSQSPEDLRSDFLSVHAQAVAEMRATRRDLLASHGLADLPGAAGL